MITRKMLVQVSIVMLFDKYIIFGKGIYFSFFSVDCNWSTWSQWSKCSRTCGTGFQLRKRTFSTAAKNGGEACVGKKNARRSCRKPKCPGKINSFNQSK